MNVVKIKNGDLGYLWPNLNGYFPRVGEYVRGCSNLNDIDKKIVKITYVEDFNNNTNIIEITLED